MVTQDALYEEEEVCEVKGRGMTAPCISERDKPIVPGCHCSLNKGLVNGLFTYLGEFEGLIHRCWICEWSQVTTVQRMSVTRDDLAEIDSSE